MLQVHTTDGSWEHRAYWGENLIAFGPENMPARQHQTDLPEPGPWSTLEVNAAALGLNHERLTYRFQGRNFRLTDVSGQVIHEVIA